METETLSRHDFFRLVGTSIGVILLSNYSTACSRQDSDDPAPVNQQVDFTLSLAEKSNENLKAKGGYVVANDVIIAQTKDGQFVAVSASCTCTSSSGTQLVYKSADNQFYCPQHLSRFDSAGKVLMGPATQSLVKYVTIADAAAGTVRIHS